MIERVQTGLTIGRLLSAISEARVLGSQIVPMNSELEDYSRNVNMLGVPSFKSTNGNLNSYLSN